MKILFISDLHLGDGSKADDFKNDESLIQWITDLNPDEVFLVGDVYELWQFKEKNIRKAHPKICNYFDCDLFTWVRGNHDYSLSGRLNYELKTFTNDLILVSHGFQNDKMMTSPVSRFFIWLLGKTLEKVFPNIDNETGYKFTRNKSRTVKNTRAYANSMFEKYDIVICGHDHKIKIEKYGPKIYANCGTCQQGKLQGIWLDTFTGKIKKVRG